MLSLPGQTIKPNLYIFGSNKYIKLSTYWLPIPILILYFIQIADTDNDRADTNFKL